MSRRVLVDECVNRRWVLPPFLSIAECIFVKDLDPAATDEDVLALARREDCLLLTEDADFGRLIFGAGRAPPPGIILAAMFKRPPHERLARMSAEAAAAISEAKGAFIVIDAERRRRKPFPIPPEQERE